MLPKKQLIVLKGILALFLLTAATGFAEETAYDYNHGLSTLSLRSQSPAQSLRLTLPLIIPSDIKPWNKGGRTKGDILYPKSSIFNRFGAKCRLDNTIFIWYSNLDCLKPVGTCCRISGSTICCY